MNRFSVIYLLKKQYHHIDFATHAEANASLTELLTQDGYRPIGVYDAKTELFYWEPTRQHQYNKASIEKQGKLATQMIRMAQTLRQRAEALELHTDSISQLLHIDEY